MNHRPGWLPPLIGCDGEWAKTLGRLYAIFEQDFVTGRPRFRGKRVWWDRKVLPGETYAEGFWHLITRDDRQSGARVPDYRRAERLCWCRPMLEHAEEPEVACWDAKTSSDIRTYLWLEQEDYVVVLKQRNVDVVVLVTAYYLDGDASRRKLRHSYANRL